MYQYKKEDLDKMVKKSYQFTLVQHILDLQDKVKELEEENASLKTEAETARSNYDKASNSLAMEIGTKMMDWMSKCSLSRDEVHDIVEDDVKNNLRVTTEAD